MVRPLPSRTLKVALSAPLFTARRLKMVMSSIACSSRQSRSPARAAAVCPGGRCCPHPTPPRDHCYCVAVTLLIWSCVRFSWVSLSAVVPSVVALQRLALQLSQALSLLSTREMLLYFERAFEDTLGHSPRGASAGQPAGVVYWSSKRQATANAGCHTSPGRSGDQARVAADDESSTA